MAYINLSDASELVHRTRPTLFRLVQQGRIKSRQALIGGRGPIWQVDMESLIRYYTPLKSAEKPASTSKRKLHADIEASKAHKKILIEELAILDEEIQMRQQLLDLLR